MTGWIAFLAATAVFAVTPGPATLYAAARSSPLASVGGNREPRRAGVTLCPLRGRDRSAKDVGDARERGAMAD